MSGEETLLVDSEAPTDRLWNKDHKNTNGRFLVLFPRKKKIVEFSKLACS